MMKTEEGGAFMKCQHCGINFDDSERECPICGARAGSRGRLGADPKRVIRARGTAPERESRVEYQSAKARPAGRRARTSAKPIQENRKKNNGRVIIVVIIIFVLVNLLPSIISVVSEVWDNFTYSFDSLTGSSDAYTDTYDDDLVYVPGEDYSYDPDNYRFVRADLQTLTGGRAAAELADGSTLELEVEPGEMGDYVLTVQDGTGTYTENGYTWCSYNYPEELSYDENFPPDQYDCFTLSLSAEAYFYSDGSAVPERYALDEYGERWFLLYYASESGVVVLEDLNGSPLFEADEYVALATLENG